MTGWWTSCAPAVSTTFWDARDGAWRFTRRQCIYETDRIIPVTPGPTIPFDAERLARYPEGYRHLGYVQELAGMQVNPSLPGRNGPELDRLYQRGRAWLAAGPHD